MSESNLELNELRKELDATKEAQNKIMEMLMLLTSSMNKESKQEVKVEEDRYVVRKITNTESPKADELIRVQSLTKGELSLSVEGKVVLQLSKYGDIKPVLYSTLVNIVNSNRQFAESGRFYILDDRAVYQLGLSSYYEHIISADMIRDIESYSDNDIKKMINSITDEQKDVIARIFIDKIYREEKVDHNKVELIAKLCNVDINAKIREMRVIEQNM